MKTGFLITARLKSTRLKRKILLDIDGESVLDKVIKRCQAVKAIDEIVLCTSTNDEDTELVREAGKHGISCFRGDEDDVLKRLLDAARIHSIDRFLSITADNPLHSVLAAEKVLDFDNIYHTDFTFTYNLPIGISPYFIRTDALDVAVFMKKKSDTEIWGPFVNRPDFFSVGNIMFEGIELPQGLRITCDYEQDYRFIKAIYAGINNNLPDINDIILLYKQQPGIFNINEGIIQRMPDESTLNQINAAFDENRETGLTYAASHQITLKPEKIKILVNSYGK